MYSTGVGLVLKGFEELEENSKINNINIKNKEEDKESLIDRISSWFIEDQLN